MRASSLGCFPWCSLPRLEADLPLACFASPQPLEAVRIRLVSNPAFASGLAGGFGRILKEEGIGGFYAGFGPILFKQIPYTMAKFAVYEVAFEKICTAAGKKPSELTEGTKTAFNLSAGLIAGLAAAFVRRPLPARLAAAALALAAAAED